MYKTHTCGELRPEHIGQTVQLAGWINNRRDMGGVLFLDLRDRWGITQVVVDSGTVGEELFAVADQLRSEYVVQFEGEVVQRLEGMQNDSLDTGQVEVKVSVINVLNKSKTPPLLIDRDGGEDESLRLKYRYLDLRRQRMQRNLTVRHNAIKYIRDFLSNRDFLEIETPILFKSTPEGARDYLVPSRVHPGKFYALPQSPQQLKQLLMVAGYEKYFQIARCFRDEDQRSDRQPEFTQLDMEMSFIERDDLLALVENLAVSMIQAVSPIPLASTEIPRMSYREATERYGSDRPDTSFEMELVDVSDVVKDSGFKVFASNVKAGNPVKAMCIKGCGNYSRKDMSELEDFAKKHGAKGLAYIAWPAEADAVRGPIAKFFSDEEKAAICEAVGAEQGDLIVFASDTRFRANTVLGELRNMMGAKLGLKRTDSLSLLWVIDFPLFEEELNDDGKPTPMHHMFTSPKQEHMDILESKPLDVLADAYDLICNGYEIGGGSIRIHEADLQSRVMDVMGMSLEEARDQFGHLLDAFEYGAPPHGGLALGLDRFVALMTGEPNIREVMAFPKNQQAYDVMADAPSYVEANQLRDIHIQLGEKALLAQMGGEEDSSAE